MPKMRAKMVLNHIEKHGETETLHFNAVAKSTPYPEDGSDEDNSFARWTPSATLQMHIANPELVGTFEKGEVYYLDFTKV